MSAHFICHKDFSALRPIELFHKELAGKELPTHPEDLQNRHILFRRKLTLADIASAVLRISADDRYKLYINGQFVTEGPSPSYPHCYYYNELDVRPYLRAGENTLAIHTYYQGLINRAHVSGDLRQMLWLELEVNGRTALESDESFLCAAHTGYSACGIIAKGTAFCERYDSRAPEDGFFLPDFDDSAWEHASLYEHADYTLLKQPTRQLVLEPIRPIVTERRGSTLFLDFGRETAGYLTLTAKGTRGDTLLLRYGEELNADGSVRYEMRANCRYEEQWILSGGLDTLRPFDYRGYRYVELILPDGAELVHTAMLARHYPYTERHIYRESDEAMQKILRLCADTIKYGTQEVFIDCPTREKGQYLGDLSVSGRAQAILTQDTTLLKKAILDFCHTSFICPGLMAVSTASKMQEIADYSLQLPALAVWVYSMDGDPDFLRTVEPYATALYAHMRTFENADGLLESVCDKWNLVDWPDNLRDGYSFPLTNPPQRGLHNVINAFWCGFLQAMDELYALLGLPETGRTQATKHAFVRTFYNERTGLFCDAPDLIHSAVHANLLPMLFDIGTADASLCTRIAEMIGQKRLTSMGVYMAYFALAALKKHGFDTLVRELILDSGAWRNMLDEGATTTFEAWGRDQKKNCSLFHPWAAAPLIVLADGIRIY